MTSLPHHSIRRSTPGLLARWWRVGMIIIMLLSAALPTATPAFAANLTVDSTTDAVDSNPGNGSCATAGGFCSLRAAIQEANALAGADTITLPAGTYTLTITGTAEDLAATGDLDITEAVVISGASVATTIIQAGRQWQLVSTGCLICLVLVP
jgi:CSLREA domain-containing protein